MMEDFKRPNHNDFKDSSELRKEKFSGVRHNSITNEMEIWTLGDMRGAVPVGDKEGFDKLYKEVFAI